MSSIKHVQVLQKNTPRVTSFLLLLTIVTLFIVPLSAEPWLSRLYALLFSAIFLSAAFALKGSSSLLFRLSLLIVLVTTIGSFLSEGYYKSIGRILQFIFFILLVVSLIRQIAVSPVVSGLVIMDAITAYLLLGFAFGLIVLIADTLLPDAYSVSMLINTAQGDKPDFRAALYYTFVTYTTTGYGDVIPRHPATKSLAVLISICGQLYVAIILALLVGKFASGNRQSTQKS
jgi:voltage-gated potassium channel